MPLRSAYDERVVRRPAFQDESALSKTIQCLANSIKRSVKLDNPHGPIWVPTRAALSRHRQSYHVHVKYRNLPSPALFPSYTQGASIPTSSIVGSRHLLPEMERMMSMPEASSQSSQASPRTPGQKRERDPSPMPSPTATAEEVEETPASAEQDEASLVNAICSADL